MKTLPFVFFRFVCIVILALNLSLFISGCSDDDNDYDHNPPDGMGSLIVDNHTDNDMAVYVDGREQDKTDEDDWKAYDLEPGEYRIFLREKGGDRSSSLDADILEDRLTILDVQNTSYLDQYDIFIRYD